MRYLSLDIEATGLYENSSIIEFAVQPFCAKTQTIAYELSFHRYIKCESFEKLKPSLDKWVIEHNKSLIEKAHNEGLPIKIFQQELTTYLESTEVKEYFKGNDKIVLFGKSMNAIDLPFLSRDLGFEYMRKYFKHRMLDFSSLAYGLIDMGILAPGDDSGEVLMKKFNMGEVNHTALADAVNTAKMYFKVLDLNKHR